MLLSSKGILMLPPQDDKEFKVSVREGSSSGSSASDLKSKLLGERRDSSSDRYAELLSSFTTLCGNMRVPQTAIGKYWFCSISSATKCCCYDTIEVR